MHRRVTPSRPEAGRSKGFLNRPFGFQLQWSCRLVSRFALRIKPVYHTYTTNYGGPLRKSGTSNFQLIATVLVNVCYRLYADVRPFRESPGTAASDGPGCLARHKLRAHAYQEMFDRRLQRGQWFRTPLPRRWREFVPDYLGPFRSDEDKVVSRGCQTLCCRACWNASFPGKTTRLERLCSVKT